MIHPCGYIDLPVSLGEAKNKRIMNVHFFVIPSESVYNGILGQSFFATLDVVVSPIHLKMKYNNDFDNLIIFKDDMCGDARDT